MKGTRSQVADKTELVDGSVIDSGVKLEPRDVSVDESKVSDPKVEPGVKPEEERRLSSTSQSSTVFQSPRGSFSEENNIVQNGMSEKRKLVERPRIYVFDGVNIEEFVTRMKFGLRRDGLYSMVKSSAIEAEYRTDTEQNQDDSDKYKDFRQPNAEALAYIVDHLSARVLLRVKNCVTAYEMHTRLQTLYRVASDVGRDAARSELFGLKYTDGRNMAKYIERFERAADHYRDLGGELSEKEEIEQFRTSLSATFNDVRKWFSSLPDSKKTFDNLKRQALEDAEYRSREDQESTALVTHRGPSRNFNNRANFSKFNTRDHNSESDCESDCSQNSRHSGTFRKNQPIQCYKCKGFGHIAKYCANKSYNRESESPRSWRRANNEEQSSSQERKSFSESRDRDNFSKSDINSNWRDRSSNEISRNKSQRESIPESSRREPVPVKPKAVPQPIDYRRPPYSFIAQLCESQPRPKIEMKSTSLFERRIPVAKPIERPVPGRDIGGVLRFEDVSSLHRYTSALELQQAQLTLSKTNKPN
ncbi:hypothetical protein ACFE04_021563 [Oxalis oulophora]